MTTNFAFCFDSEFVLQVVVAAGGENSAESDLTVELLFLNEFEASGAGWVMGPSLPKATSGSTMNAFENGVLLIGGENQVDLYQLTYLNGTWTKMKQTLKEARYGHVSFLVPDELVNCH